jgi:hypothetical protein
MAHARVLFDLDKHGPEVLADAIRRMPPGGALTLTQSAVTIAALPGAARRFTLKMPPKVTWRPDVDVARLKSHTEAAEELIRVHRGVVERMDGERSGT